MINSENKNGNLVDLRTIIFLKIGDGIIQEIIRSRS